DGFARAIYPVHTPLDGDVVFAAATGKKPLQDPYYGLAELGMAAANVMAPALAPGGFGSQGLAVPGGPPALDRRLAPGLKLTTRLARCGHMPSLAISNIGYDRQTERLTVTFMTGRIYEYVDVPAEVAAAFRSAFSKGTYFNGYIRDRYDFREVTSAC